MSQRRIRPAAKRKDARTRREPAVSPGMADVLPDEVRRFKGPCAALERDLELAGRTDRRLCMAVAILLLLCLCAFGMNAWLVSSVLRYGCFGPGGPDWAMRLWGSATAAFLAGGIVLAAALPVKAAYPWLRRYQLRRRLRALPLPEREHVLLGVANAPSRHTRRFVAPLLRELRAGRTELVPSGRPEGGISELALPPLERDTT